MDDPSQPLLQLLETDLPVQRQQQLQRRRPRCPRHQWTEESEIPGPEALVLGGEHCGGEVPEGGHPKLPGFLHQQLDGTVLVHRLVLQWT